MAARQRDWAAEYRRRVGGTAPGSRARQEARGHKEKSEYRRRRERELASGGLTSSQREQIKITATKQAAKAGMDPKAAYAMLLAFANRNGYDAFRQYRDQIKKFKSALKVRVTGGIARIEGELSNNRGLMEDLAERWGIDWTLFFYK
jgi:hypothetical protein